LNIVLNNRASTKDTESWTGAVLSGIPYTTTIPLGITGQGLGTVNPDVHVSPTCAIDSSGTVSGSDLTAIDQMETGRVDTDRKETKVVNSFTSRRAEATLQARLKGVLADLDSYEVRANSRRVDEVPTTTSDPIYSEVRKNLSNFEKLGLQKKYLEAYEEFYIARHRDRHRLLALDKSRQPSN
jgi:hypothetical protein